MKTCNRCLAPVPPVPVTTGDNIRIEFFQGGAIEGVVKDVTPGYVSVEIPLLAGGLHGVRWDEIRRLAWLDRLVPPVTHSHCEGG